MEARELRIGNYVCPDNDLAQEYQIDEQDFSQNTFARLSGIPLTKEWLLKFSIGFETTDYENNLIEWGKTGQEMFSIGQYGTPPEDQPFVFSYDIGYGEKEIEIKFVHQLQNLYFALIGEELTIK